MTKTETIELTKDQRKLIIRMTHAITRLDNHDGCEFFELIDTLKLLTEKAPQLEALEVLLDPDEEIQNELGDWDNPIVL